MKIIRNIISLILSAVFLLLSTGLFLIEHHCNYTNTTNIYFSYNHEHDCHTHSNQSENSCCSHNTTCELESNHDKNNQQSCCNDNFYYYKINLPYVISKFDFNFDKVISFVQISTNINLFSEIFGDKHNVTTPNVPPPILKTSKTFISELCILRV